MKTPEIALARYEAAVWDNPRRPDEGTFSYIARIAELVAGQETGPLPAPLKDWPEIRTPYRESSDTDWRGEA